MRPSTTAVTPRPPEKVPARKTHIDFFQLNSTGQSKRRPTLTAACAPAGIAVNRASRS
jgi:hypothetical protein